MLSGSGGMNTNFSSFFGGHPNYQIAEFTLEPEEYTVEGVLYHKYTSTVSLQIGALDGDTYSFNPVNQEYIWGKDYFDILSTRIFWPETRRIATKLSCFWPLQILFCRPVIQIT